MPTGVWSAYGAPWLQPAAINGKSTDRLNRKNEPNPLPAAATGCVRRSMVRRGRRFESVRELAQHPCKWTFSVACDGEISTLRGYETGTLSAWRALAGTRDVSRLGLGRARDSRSRHWLGKFLQTEVWCCPCWREADHLLQWGGTRPGEALQRSAPKRLGKRNTSTSRLVRPTSCPDGDRS